MSPDARPRLNRRTQLESLEDRVVMSADPLGGLLSGSITHHSIDEDPAQFGVNHHAIEEAPINAPPALSHHDFADPVADQAPDFWLNPNTDLPYDEQLREIEQSLESAHDSSGLSAARASYGFRGAGQTVAVIDSGIAWDHYALGNGFGSNYRVVGGWDFTENDADPYDDGTAGSHGTHVAGIVGANGNGAAQQGVAPDVDLVGLRVFDDAGNGYFSWVEQALDWVHENRNAFENPITAVNLSLGTNWNSDTVPSWAMLEDEFAQLKADGIFIAVSAGNSFTSYNTPGLSYPAASPHVVPVLSADDNGALSYFSQRHSRGIAAPGRYIQSTVPDYNGNNNGVTDDWGFKSGTSMAAPYVAGASVLIREAMEFVGYTNITQDTIYDHMIATADTLFDAATGQSYNRLNVEAALDALMPDDDFGSSLGTAFDLGTINPGASPSAQANMNGLIGEVNDADYFTFTAGATGTVTFAASNTTHYLDASWQGHGGEGWSDATGDSYTLNVVAGQQYTVSLSSASGIGYYDLGITAEATFTFTDWGTVAGQTSNNVNSGGDETWYRVVAGQSGYVTANLLNAVGSVNIDLYDASLGLVSDGANGRVDYYAAQGDELYLRVDGVGTADVQLTALVSLSGSTVNVNGTTGDDALTFTAGANDHTVSVNGVSYAFNTSVTTFNLDSGEGNDTVTLTGTSGDETAVLRQNDVSLSSAGFSVNAAGAQNVIINSGGGDDAATFHDTAAGETFYARSDFAWLAGSSGQYRNEVRGFSNVTANATAGGVDVAYLADSVGDDILTATSSSTVLRAADNSYELTASGFDQTRGYASGGQDFAYLYDSAGNDQFTAYSTYAQLRGVDGSYFSFAQGFDEVRAYATTGNDYAYLLDGAGDDVLMGDSTYAHFAAADASFSNYASGFDQARAYSTSGGNDIAYLYDSAGSDVFIARPEFAQLGASNNSYLNFARGFDEARAYSTAGGADYAYLYDSTGDDLFVGRPEYAQLRAADGSYLSYAEGFSQARAYASSGADIASFYDSTGDDVFTARPDSAQLRASDNSYFNFARGFDQTRAYATSGNDAAYLYDSSGNDTFTGSRSWSRLQGSGYSNRADGFDVAVGFASTGTDTATLIDSALDDTLSAESWRAKLTGADYQVDARSFDSVTADSSNGGVDSLNEVATDYAFTQTGDWV